MVSASCCTGREGTFSLKGSMPQARLPWGSQPLVLGSFRPIGLRVEVMFLFPKKPDIVIPKLQEKSYTP